MKHLKEYWKYNKWIILLEIIAVFIIVGLLKLFNVLK